MIAHLNESVPIRMLASDGVTTMYGRVNIYNSVGTIVSTISLSHIGAGLYGSSWTPAIEGFFTSVGEFFFDALFTSEAGYDKVSEDIEVSTTKSNISRLLGLSHENAVIDSQVYDGLGNATSARVRTYNSKANAQAAGGTGLIATYTMTAAYSSGALVDYKVVRDA